jgi:DNA polymerase III epsilon subunit-like protein
MYLFFDTETTGLPQNYKAPVTDLDNWPRLVQLAWLVYDSEGKKISSREMVIKPEGFSIPEESSKVHGISTEDAIERGVSLKSALDEFAKVIKDSQIVVAHNVSFDEKIIGAEFLRKKVEHDLFETIRVCTKEEATDYCQIPGYYGYKWPRLSELHIKLFGKDFEDAHDALVDVEACAKCFFELVKRGVIQS